MDVARRVERVVIRASLALVWFVFGVFWLVPPMTLLGLSLLLASLASAVAAIRAVFSAD